MATVTPTGSWNFDSRQFDGMTLVGAPEANAEVSELRYTNAAGAEMIVEGSLTFVYENDWEDDRYSLFDGEIENVRLFLDGELQFEISDIPDNYGWGYSQLPYTQDSPALSLGDVLWYVSINPDFVGTAGRDMFAYYGSSREDIRFDAGDGDDVLSLGDDWDVILGGDGNDRIYGGAGGDEIDGGSGDDHLDGSFGSDDIYGGAGNDVLRGGFGSDGISGGDGDDRLIGGTRSDWLKGGAGSDDFVFRTVEESPGDDRNPGAADRIVDFVAGEDDIDLRIIDANIHVAGDQGFTFIGYATFSGTAGELRLSRNESYESWEMAGDVDGDGRRDLLILFENDPGPITLADLAL